MTMTETRQEELNPTATDPTDTVLLVKPEEAALIAELADDLGLLANQDPDRFCDRARLLSRRIPDRIAEKMATFADLGTESGLLLVRGLHVGPVPPTPLHNRLGVARTTQFASQVAIVAHLLGDLAYYQAEGTGHLLQDMAPNPDYLHRQSSQGSEDELEAHTEQSFSPMRPDYVVLGCLRGEPTAYTYVFSARQLLAYFTNADLAYLNRPLWTTLIDDSFHPYVPDPEEIRGPFALLSGPPADPVLRLDQELTHGMTLRAQQLLSQVIECYRQHRSSFALRAGDIGFVDNTRAMHGRSRFTPRFDGTDRFVARGFVLRDLRRTSAARTPGSRQIRAAAS